MDHSGADVRKKSPRDRANILSLVTFTYTRGLFRRALKQDLEEKDLYAVAKSCSSKRCGDRIERNWNKEIERKRDDPSIARLLFHTFGRYYFTIGIVNLLWRIFLINAEPYAVSNLVDYFKPNQTSVTRNDAYFYAGATVGLNMFHFFYIHNYIIIVQQLAIRVRTSFCSLIYRKALKMTPAAVGELTTGNIVTLITKDVHTFEQSIWLVNDMWVGMLLVCVIIYNIYLKMGSASFLGISLLLSVLPLQIYMGKWMSILRLKVGKKTDERLQVTQETLSTIRIIKMYTWEKFFVNKVNKARHKEITWLLKTFCLRMSIVITGMLCSRLGFATLLISYIWLGHSPDAQLIYSVMILFRELKHYLGILIPYGMARSGDLYAAVVRIKRIICAEELKLNANQTVTDEITLKPRVSLKAVTVELRSKQILQDVTLDIDSGLILVTGAVGSGKSSLLKTILHDYPTSSGHLTTHGRISYASQDPWLFPSSIRQNILFGADFNRQKYNEVVRVCALEYDFSLLDKGDETIVADRGLNLSKGQQARINLARAVYRDSEIYLLDDSLTALDGRVQDFIFKNCIKEYLKGKIVILVTQNLHHLKECDKVVVMAHGKVKSFNSPDEVNEKDIEKIVGMDDDLERENEDKQQIVDEEEEELKEEIDKLLEDSKEETNNKWAPRLSMQKRKKVYHEVNKKGDVSLNVYNKYIKFGGGYLFFALVVAIFSCNQFTDSGISKTIGKWVDLQTEVLDYEIHNSTNSSIYWETVDLKNTVFKYLVIIIFTDGALTMLRSFLLFYFCRKASINIHKSMTTTIINACMVFFDTHFIGNILNRFSQDLTNMDESLPFVFYEFIRVFFSVCGILFLIILVKWDFIIPAIIFFIILFFLRRAYLPTGRSLKRLEAATRSPMVGHLNASLEGLTTIRAFKQQGLLHDEFDRHQDLYTSAHYTLTYSSRALGFYIDCLCSMLIMYIIFQLLFFNSGASVGDVGVVVTQVMQLAGHVQWGVRNWADLENQMTSVERLLEYTVIPQETKEGITLENWPKAGEVVFNNVSLTYNKAEKVLKNITFTLLPGQKIGIVGRTGAGKSSIIATLFRLYEVEGQVLIDGVDIKTLSLEFLRQKIAIIPQDPILFEGTIRSNIDPMNKYTDKEIWTALEKVKMKESFTSLSVIIGPSGSNFSSGQRQLICLARAIIRRNKIVVLDEATANMDPETDALLHNVIKENFTDCTVFTIAHRLHTILDADKIMVLEQGKIIEFDEPNALLEKENGMFYKMVQQSGLLSML